VGNSTEHPGTEVRLDMPNIPPGARP